MGLPNSGPISSSQVGVYVFDRTSTQEFSLSSSLAGLGVDKDYTTTLGPIWRGTGYFDVDNQQYSQGANNFSLGDWYSYFKAFGVTLGGAPNKSAETACADATDGDDVYFTAYNFFGGGSTEFAIYNNGTVAYIDTKGTNIFVPISYDTYYNVSALVTAYTIDANGVFQNEYPCL